METGLVNIDFVGVAAPVLAEIAKVQAALAALKGEVVTSVAAVREAIPGGSVVAQSVETQVAPVRAASMARRQIYKDEASESIASQEAITKANNARIEADLVAQKRFFEKSEFSYEEYLNVLKQKTAQARAVMTSAAEVPFGNAIGQNISEAERAGGAGVLPLPLPSMGAGIASEDIENSLRGRIKNWLNVTPEGGEGAFLRRRPYLVARGLESGIGAGGSALEGDIAGMAGGIGQGLTYGGAYGLITNPYVATPLIGAGIGAYGLEHTMKAGGEFQSAGARLGAGTQMSQNALDAFRRVAREQAIKAGNTPESQANDFLDAARTLVFALHLSGDEIDQNLPQLMQMMDTIRRYAVAMGIPVNEAASDLVTKFNLTGGKATDKEAASEFKRVADLFASATTRGALQPEQLGAAVRKSGGVAAFEGVPTPDLLAALEIMGTTGDSGQIIGTAMRQYLLSLGGAKMSPKLGKELQGAGLSMQDISIARKSLPDAIQVLKEHIGTMEPEQRNALLKDLFGQRWESFYQQLSTNLPEFRQIRAEIAQGGGLERMAGKMEQTVPFKEGEAGKKFQDAFLKLFIEHESDFDHLADDFVKMAGALASMEPLMGKFVTMISNITDTLTGQEHGTKLPGDVLAAGAPLSKGLGVPAGRTLEAQIHKFDQQFSHWFDNTANSPQKEATRSAIITTLGYLMQENDELANPDVTDKRRAALYEAIKKQFQALRGYLGIKSDADFENQGGTESMGRGLGIFGYSHGGYTGDIAPHEPAGVVHGGEFVFDAVSTRRAGVQRLRALQKRLRGYAEGDFVQAPFLSGVSAATNTGASLLGDDTLDRLFHMSYTPHANVVRRGIERTLSGIASTAGTLLSATTPTGALNLITQEIKSNAEGQQAVDVKATEALYGEMRAFHETFKATNFTRIVDQNKFAVSQDQYNAMESWRAK